MTRAFIVPLLLLSGCYLSHTIPCAVADPELCEAAAALDGLRWELPCLGSGPPEICSTEPRISDGTVFAPDLGGRFAVTLRFRGVVETKRYVGGEADGFFSIGGRPDTTPWNLYALQVARPAATYYLNHGVTERYHCLPIDYERTVTIATGSRITLDAQVFDGFEITNHDERGDPIVVPGVDPAPEPFDGQFIQADVVDIRRLP